MSATSNVLQMYPTEVVRLVLKRKPKRGIPLLAMKKSKIDTAWFLIQIDESGLSIRELAGRMVNRQGKPMDRGNLWRLLHGTSTREMTVSEAVQFSEILEISLDEIARRALGKKR